MGETEEEVDCKFWCEKTRRPKSELWGISTFWTAEGKPANDGSEMKVGNPNSGKSDFRRSGRSAGPLCLISQAR